MIFFGKKATLIEKEALDLNLNPKPYYMKKTILLVAASLATIVASAQMTSKNGSAILPESGDWSIGIGATSTLNYFGNLMNGDNDAMAFDWTNGGNVITGKMMKDANTAYRAGIRLGFGSTSSSESNPATGELSKTTLSGSDITLSGGIQKYRGKGRVQGIYGAEALINLGGGKTEYEYNGTPGAGSILTSKDGSTFGLGVRGFIGVEYFFAPKMSLSGEFGWGLALASTGEGETTSADGSGGSTSVKTAKSSTFGVDTDNAGGSINLNFYF